MLGEYDGTVLLVSHDRDFLDRVASHTVAFEGDGRAEIYAGGWSDYLAQKPADDGMSGAGKPAASQPKPVASKPKQAGLSFTEKHRLEALPDEIEKLESEIAKLEGLLSDPELFTREPAKFAKATEALSQRQGRLAASEDEWLALEEKSVG